jgi:hypothetical protein
MSRAPRHLVRVLVALLAAATMIVTDADRIQRAGP